MKLKSIRENFVRTDDIKKYVEECLLKLKKTNNITSAMDTIILAEAICDYLQKEHIRYKKSIEKYGE